MVQLECSTKQCCKKMIGRHLGYGSRLQLAIGHITSSTSQAKSSLAKQRGKYLLAC